jgi:hypothetical protein
VFTCWCTFGPFSVWSIKNKVPMSIYVQVFAWIYALFLVFGVIILEWNSYVFSRCMFKVLKLSTCIPLWLYQFIFHQVWRSVPASLHAWQCLWWNFPVLAVLIGATDNSLEFQLTFFHDYCCWASLPWEGPPSWFHVV